MVESLLTLFSAIGLGVAAARALDVRVVATVACTVAVASGVATADFVAAGRPGQAGATLVELTALLVPILLLARCARERDIRRVGTFGQGRSPPVENDSAEDGLGRDGSSGAQRPAVRKGPLALVARSG